MVGLSSLGEVADLIQTGMTSMHAKEFIATFKAFVRVILVKLGVSEVTNNYTKQSFIFSFRHLIRIGLFCLFVFLLFFYCSLSFICGHLILLYYQAFLNFTNVERLHEITKFNIDKAIR